MSLLRERLSLSREQRAADRISAQVRRRAIRPVFPGEAAKAGGARQFFTSDQAPNGLPSRARGFRTTS
jgi:hypothetical protein